MSTMDQADEQQRNAPKTMNMAEHDIKDCQDEDDDYDNGQMQTGEGQYDAKSNQNPNTHRNEKIKKIIDRLNNTNKTRSRNTTQAEEHPSKGFRIVSSSSTVKRISETISSIPDKICNNKFLVLKKHILGSGTYGDTVIVSDQNSIKYAAKLERQQNQKRPVLYFDQQFVDYLYTKCHCTCVPQFIEYGIEGKYAYLIMELLGPSIADIIKNSLPVGLSQTTLVYLATGMLNCLAAIHRCDIIHRDIKPDNFAFGSLKKPRTIFIFDFGLSKQYRAFGKHIPFRTGKVLTGTARYVSINTHRGLEQSRRDDLESCGYCIIFFFRKAYLPWMGLKHLTKIQHFKEIARLKTESSIQTLIDDCPKQLGDFVKYCRKLAFDMEPNYEHLLGLLLSILPQEFDLNSTVFEWENDEKLRKSLHKSLYRISNDFNSPSSFPDEIQ